MTTEQEGAARALLVELEDRLATHDLDRIVDLFDSEVVLIGDAEENFDRDSTVSYLRLMADMEATVRWEWDHVVVVHSTPETLAFAATGQMGFHDPSGQLLGETERFRVTCLAVETPSGWKLRHFHGSEPSGD